MFTRHHYGDEENLPTVYLPGVLPLGDVTVETLTVSPDPHHHSITARGQAALPDATRALTAARDGLVKGV